MITLFCQYYPTLKKAFLMFGSVDFDFTLIRYLSTGEGGIDDFIKSRVDCYIDFIKTLKNDDEITFYLDELVVLAPQISPLCGENFFVQTSIHTGLEKYRIKELANEFKLSDSDRASYISKFTDILIGNCPIEVLRIDRDMVDRDNLIHDKFLPIDKSDHHARIDSTQSLWFKLINSKITDRSLSS